MSEDKIIITVSTRRLKEDELSHLRSVKRPEITEAIKRARAYGDLSENFEYQAARQAQAILNGRIAEIEAVLERATTVPDRDGKPDEVAIGAVVVIRHLETDDDWELTIVDAVSADPDNDKISYSAPVGRALMGRKVGDKVAVTLPNGLIRYEVVSVD